MPAIPDQTIREDAFWLQSQSGGEATSLDAASTSHSFSYPLPSLNEQELNLHLLGDVHFERPFSDESQLLESGLGPAYNNSSCIACHNLDGRGSLPLGLNTHTWTQLGVNEALFLRVSIENEEILNGERNAANQFGAPVPVPGYSSQLFHVGSFGLRDGITADGQASVRIKLDRSEFQYPDGEKVSLTKPLFKIDNPYDVTADPITGLPTSRLWQNDVRVSPRMGMPMYGLGLLEAIPDADILQNAKIDYSAEGVHGAVNFVWDVLKEKSGDPHPVSIGRFGLKANTPTIEHQSMAALNGDMGVTNPLFPIESLFGTDLFDSYLKKHPAPKKVEIDEQTMEALIFYSKTLAVPPRRGIENPEVILGGKLFLKISCTNCHTPSWRTGDSKIRALANQKIYPYTDLLLHDMGEGLADGRQDFLANGRQWKTRPLWGIGLTKVVNPRAGFLHDGRAQTLEEAILWHDGEARYSRDLFSQLRKSDRQKVIQFLQSL